MNLSQHFTLAELTFSRTATAAGIDNTPADAERSNLEALCRLVLDPLRDAAGAAIKVTSGFRGPVLNAAIKGERKSQHLEGKAADIQPTTMSVLELFKTVIRSGLPFDQLIYEPKSATSKWVHVSHDSASNRGQILRAHFLPTGKVARYEPLTAAQALALEEAVSRSGGRIQPLEYDEMGDEPGDDTAAPAPAVVETVPAKKVPARKKTAQKAPKKTPAKKTPAKKTPAKKTPAKKTAKTAAKKAVVKKTAAKAASSKKASPKKTTAKKTTSKSTKPATRRAAKPPASKRSARA